MDFDLGDLTSLTPSGTDGDDNRGVGVPPPLGCVVIMVLICAGLAYLGWRIWG